MVSLINLISQLVKICAGPAFRENPLYNPARVCLIQPVYHEIQEDDRPISNNTVMCKLNMICLRFVFSLRKARLPATR